MRAELYPASLAASEPKGIVSWLRDLGYEMKPVLVIDVKATEYIFHRQGLGKLKHTDVAYLWMQDEIRSKSCVRRAKSEENVRKFGDLITADHKVLLEGRESRDNHWYAVVVQDLATQWIQSYPCKTKTSHERDGEKFVKIIGAVAQTKSCIHRQLVGMWQSCEDLSWNHHTSNTSSIRDKWHR